VIALIWALIFAAIYGVVVFLLEKPQYISNLISAGLFLVWLIYVIVKKIMAVIRAKKRVQALIKLEQDGTADESESVSAELSAEQFRTRLKRFIKTLKRTKLKQKGDPLYVLPWYLITGEKGMGMEKALENARLSQPHLEDDDFLKGEDTSIYPYSEAVAITTPNHGPEGHYEEKNWNELLKSIKAYRKKEPINGIVMSVSYASLISKNEDELFDAGKKNIRQIHHAISVLQYNVPLYLFVTDCEKMEGYTEFARSLPDDVLDQAMGCVNSKNSTNSIAFVSKSLDSIIENVHARVLRNINDNSAELCQVALGLKLSNLKGKLDLFLKGAFKENPYQEAPPLKGVYFSGVMVYNNENGKNKRGLFLHHFFTDVLPSDRHVELVPSYARKIDNRRMAVRSLWAAFLLVCTVFVYWKYDTAKGYLNTVQSAKAGKYMMSDSLQGDLPVLYDYYNNLVDVDQEVYTWGEPRWYGYTAEPDFITQLKGIFVSRYKLHNFVKIKGKENAVFHELFESFLQQKELDEDSKLRIALFIEVCVRKINYLNSFLNKGFFGFSKDRLPCFALNDPIDLGFVDEHEIEKLNELQTVFLTWSDDEALLKRELKAWRDRFNRLLKFSDRAMSWVTPMVSGRMDPIGYSLESYWPGVGEIPEEFDIAPIYTASGKKSVELFLEKLKEVNTEPELFNKLEENFWKKYEADYIKGWQRFALNFNAGSSSLVGREDWLTMLDVIGSSRNPYFRLLDDMHKNLAPYLEKEELPDWLDLLKYYDEMLAYDPNYSAKSAAKKKKVATKALLGVLKVLGPAGKAVAGVGKKGLKTQKKLGSKASKDELLPKTGAALGEYRKALNEIPFKATDRENSYLAMYNLFSNPDAPGKGMDSAAKVMVPLQTLKRLLGKETVRSAPFWRVIGGPVAIIRHFMVHEAAEEIQKKWENKVLIPIQNSPEYKRVEMLHSPTGLLKSFRAAEVKPFISQTVKGNFLPVLVKGMKMPFYSEFFNLLARSRDMMLSMPAAGFYEVKLTMLPIECNLNAKKLPSKMWLTLKGMSDDQELVSTNFNNLITYRWGDTSSDFTLKLKIADLELKKVYRGQRGFAYFLKDFEFGSHRFAVKDFPDVAEELTLLKVEYIDVSFELRGHGAVIKALDQNPEILPKKITSGW
jgi:type VI secretion system protein ImpL